MSEPVIVGILIAAGSSAVVGICATLIRISNKVGQILVMLGHATAESAEIKSSFSKCQENCRVRSGDYIRTETQLRAVEARVLQLEREA